MRTCLRRNEGGRTFLVRTRQYGGPTWVTWGTQRPWVRIRVPLRWIVASLPMVIAAGDTRCVLRAVCPLYAARGAARRVSAPVRCAEPAVRFE